MNYFRSVNSIHLSYLSPLLKWKIMDIRSLMGESNYPLGHSGFKKIIQRIEKLGVIAGLRDPFSKRKYIFLTGEGIKYLSGNAKLLIATEGSPLHDAKASEICRHFLTLPTVEKVTLEHEFSMQNSVIPDGAINGKKNGVSYCVAFELELTQKSKSRIIGKVQSYFSSTDFDYLIYFFASKQLMNSYRNTIDEAISEPLKNRIMYFCNEQILSRDYSLAESAGYFKGSEVTLGKLF